MANEVIISGSIRIRKPNPGLKYTSLPTAFKMSMSGNKGPVPGSITVHPAGTNVDFSQLTIPGPCRITNQDLTNYIEIGSWDPDTNTFIPLFELYPGEFQIIPRLSRFLGKEMGSGSGTAPTGSSAKIRIKAHTAPCNVNIEAFEA